MKNTRKPYYKEEIVESLKKVYADVTEQIKPLSLDTFHQQPGQKWSIANQLEHLIISSKGIASALRMPKEQLAGFGKPNGPSRNYESLYKLYYEVLATGLKAPPLFEPNVSTDTSIEKMLNNWNMISTKFSERIIEWDDQDFDKYVLPHPAIGNLTMREILLFTIFHTEHHGKSIQKLIENATV